MIMQKQRQKQKQKDEKNTDVCQRDVLQREKGRDLIQSYDKSPYTNRNVKRAK